MPTHTTATPQPTTWQNGTTYTVGGVSWGPNRTPHLRITPTGTPHTTSINLLNHTLQFAITPGPKKCLGYITFTDAGRSTTHHCPHNNPATRGTQCDHCAAADHFKHAHHVHHGTPVSPGLATYLAQPHRLYIATFADATSKVGTAATARGHARLDEQGPSQATYIATAPNGTLVRTLEDAITSVLGVPQTKRKTAKLKALLNPETPQTITQAHHNIVTEALSYLRLDHSTEPADYTSETWPPPAPHHTNHNTPPAAYPHDLSNGPHRVTATAATGSILTAHTGPHSPHYLVDVDHLKGTTVTPGNHEPPPLDIQESLF